MIQHMRLCPHPIHHHSEVVNIQIHCFLCWLLVRLVWCVGNGHSAHVCTGVHFGNHSTMGHTCTYVGIRIDTSLIQVGCSGSPGVQVEQFVDDASSTVYLFPDLLSTIHFPSSIF